MKKTYITPCAETGNLQTEGLMAVSVGMGTDERNGADAWSREEEDLFWEDEQGW